MQVPSREQEITKSAESITGLAPVGPEAENSIHWALRTVFCGIGIGLLGLLLVAATLSPDPRGLGTHEQLGLPPCGIKFAFGVPCPSCGMTTAWSLAVKGNWVASAQTNAGGFLMAILALPASIWLLGSSWNGRWVIRQPNPLLISGIFAAMIAAAMIQWALRVY